MKIPKLSADLLIAILLFVLLLAWGPIYQKFMAPPRDARPQPAVARPVAATNAVAPDASVAAAAPATIATAAAAQNATAEWAASPTETQEPEEEAESETPERTLLLTNACVQLTLSSRGGGIKTAELTQYRTALDPRSAPVRLDFSERPSLTYRDLPGFSSATDFELATAATAQTVRLTRKASNGLELQRAVTLLDRYMIQVDDVLVNRSGQSLALADHGIQVGPMALLPGEVRGKADQFLGIDTLASGGGQAVQYWNSKSFFAKRVTLVEMFQPEERRTGGCFSRRPHLTQPLPPRIRHPLKTETDWVAVKSKFFVQILSPVGGSSSCELQAERWVPPTENRTESRTWAQTAGLRDVAAVMRFEGRTLAPGDVLQRRLLYYVGPREYTTIRVLGNHQDEVMEFGMWAWLCKWLVWALKAFYRVIPNYGVAIILLTFVIRIIFWPVTHKSTESMKKMQALQPHLMALREKYKGQAQKLQQETMALYKAHKVNPLGGCLPMLIQIPVFIALFNVLRGDIGLRFASFLWIRDLSEPENLLAGLLPFGLGLNLMPIYMAVTMAWQQKLTPSSGDPSQQTMMMIMPVFMLIFFYTMPSGLILYWSVNQTMMIVQLYWQRYRSQRQPAT
jgi:YidC/Oxa1 family membrane protein insertase